MSDCQSIDHKALVDSDLILIKPNSGGFKLIEVAVSSNSQWSSWSMIYGTGAKYLLVMVSFG